MLELMFEEKKTANILMVIGTRPEAIKMLPLAIELMQQENINLTVCSTGQHKELLNPIFKIFNVNPQINLNLMNHREHIVDTFASIILGVSRVIITVKPDLVIVHGDTNTSSAAALASYQNSVPIAHVEAGLRTGNIYSPWPEEGNRKLISSLASIHFAPTKQAKANLISEAIPADRILVTGNTVIDALEFMINKIQLENINSNEIFDFDGKIILITAHRRENYDEGIKNICQAIKFLARQNPDKAFAYPVHLNPNIRDVVMSSLTGIHNVFLLDPLDYPDFCRLLSRSYLVLTDSGGIQEEAPHLGKPVLVMRDNSERPEAIEAGVARLVGTDTDRIVNETQILLNNVDAYNRMAKSSNPYGDGNACKRIVNKIKIYFEGTNI